MLILKNITLPTLFIGKLHLSRLEAKHFNQKFAKIKLTSVGIKFAYHIANIFFKVIKILIHIVLFSSWVHVRKAQLWGWFFYVKDVINKLPNLDNVLKHEFEYKKL